MDTASMMLLTVGVWRRGKTDTASMMLLTVGSVWHFQQDCYKGELEIGDVQVGSLRALSPPVSTVRATASDPQLSMRKR